MILRVTQNQKIDILHIDPPVPDHLQFHDDVKLFLLDIVIVIENSDLIEFHQGEGTLSFEKKRKKLLIPLFVHFSEKIVIVPFLDPTLQIDIFSKSVSFHGNPHWVHVQGLHLQLKDLLVV